MKRVNAISALLIVLLVGCSDNSYLKRIADSNSDAPNAKQPLPQAAQKQLESNWLRFRGPNGSGLSNATGLPTEWSETKNFAWKTKLPGPGSSSPIVVNDRIYLTCYSGYASDKSNPGDPKNLKRHLLCVDSKNGRVIWDKTIVKDRNISHYQHFMKLHGYASSSPVSDGERIYAYFGSWGVVAFDLQGKKLWTADCGDRVHGFGSGASPILHGNLLIVNASVESQSLYAIDKRTGDEVWRTKEIHDAWNTPILVESDGKTQIVLTTRPAIMSFDAATGRLLWQYNGAKQNTYVCPSLVVNDGVIYGMSSYHGPVVAVRANGKEFWKSSSRFRTTVVSPVCHDNHIYYPDDGGSQVACFDARTGDAKKIQPLRGRFAMYASPLVADGKLYMVTRNNGTLVYTATPDMQRLAHNTLAGDDSQFNASPVPLGRSLLLRSEKFLYRIGTQQ